MGEEAGQSPPSDAQTDTPGRTTSIGVPKESAEGERRVALVPKVIEKLAKRGGRVVVESGAGVEALIPDEHYTEAGAEIGDPWSCDVVVKVGRPSVASTDRLSSIPARTAFASRGSTR